MGATQLRKNKIYALYVFYLRFSLFPF